MSNPTYTEYLQSEHWFNLRIEALNAANRACESCSSPFDLQGHHLQYRQLYDCTKEDIVCLCESCHTRWHEHYPASQRCSRDFLLGFLSGLSKSCPVKRKLPVTQGTRKQQKRAARAEHRGKVWNDPYVLLHVVNTPYEDFYQLMRVHFQNCPPTEKSQKILYARWLWEKKNNQKAKRG